MNEAMNGRTAQAGAGVPLITEPLLDEYQTLIPQLGDKPSDDAIVGALVSTADWTPEGARAVLSLSRTYGTAILRNALALAHAIGIEDGDSGL